MFEGDSCPGGKRSKKHVTALFCTNEDSLEKLPKLIIVKFAKPRFFKNLKILPGHCNVSKIAWMTSSISTFLQQLDGKMLASARKMPLLLDNASSHPPDQLHFEMA